MKDALQEFVAASFPLKGLAAWSVRLPDREVLSQSYAPWLPAPKAEQALARMVLAAEGFRQHHLEVRHLCWIFEHLRLYLARHEDGAYLAVIVKNALVIPVAPAEEALERFRRLRG